MNFSSFSDVFRRFETGNVLAWLQSLNLGDLMHNRYFIAGVAVVALVAFLLKWRLLLATVLGLAGFVALLSYTLQQGATLQGGVENSSLLVFVGGGIVIVGFVIYLLFIRSD